MQQLTRNRTSGGERLLESPPLVQNLGFSKYLRRDQGTHSHASQFIPRADLRAYVLAQISMLSVLVPIISTG